MELPVISTTVGSIDEAVEDGVTGYLIEPKNTLLLEEKLTMFLGDETLRRQMGKAGRDRAQTRFSLDAMLDAMEKVFYQVLDRRAAP